MTEAEQIRLLVVKSRMLGLPRSNDDWWLRHLTTSTNRGRTLALWAGELTMPDVVNEIRLRASALNKETRP